MLLRLALTLAGLWLPFAIAVVQFPSAGTVIRATSACDAPVIMFLAAFLENTPSEHEKGPRTDPGLSELGDALRRHVLLAEPCSARLYQPLFSDCRRLHKRAHGRVVVETFDVQANVVSKAVEANARTVHLGDESFLRTMTTPYPTC